MDKLYFELFTSTNKEEIQMRNKMEKTDEKLVDKLLGLFLARCRFINSLAFF
jgi:hypothetical protein